MKNGNFTKILLSALGAMIVMLTYCVGFVAATAVHEAVDANVIGLIGAAAFFVMQLIFCIKAHRVSAKLIPLYTMVPILIACVMFFAEKSFGAIIVLLMLLLALVYAVCGMAAAWAIDLIVYLIRICRKNKYR